MREPWWVRLVPRGVREEICLPAWHDLQIERLSRGRRRTAGAAWYAAQLSFLILECWRLALTAERRPDAPPKERLAMFTNDLRHACRLLIREPGFTLAALLTLALGVGANIAVFAVVEAVLLRPLPYARADRLVILNHRDQRTGIAKTFIAMGDYVDLVKRQSVFASVGGYGSGQATVAGLGEPFRARVLDAAAGLLETLDVHPVLGRSLQPSDSRRGAAPVLLVSYDFWQTHLGADPLVVGRGIRLDQVTRQVVGVAPPGLRFPPNQPNDLILPMSVPTEAPAQRKSGWTFAVARLKDSASLSQADAHLAALSRQLQQEYPASNAGSLYFATPLRDALVGNTKPILLLMLAAVGVVLLIACSNVANLLLARAVARRREMAIRLAMGAGYLRLAMQLLTESLVLAALAGSAGVLVAAWGARAIVRLIPDYRNTPGLAEVHIGASTIGVALGLSAATAVVFGMLSALSLRRGRTAETLTGAARVSAGAPGRRLASGLVVAEVSLAIVLLFGAGLILRSFARLLSVDPGFRTDHVATASVLLPSGPYRAAEARTAFYQRAAGALQALPDVREAGAAVVTPLTGNNWTQPFERIDRPAPAQERPPEVGWQLASGGYFRALRIPLLSGRLFDAHDAVSGKPVVIVSQAIERQFFPHESAVGHAVRFEDRSAEIVGVVGDVRRAGLRDAPRADMYLSMETRPSSECTFFVRTAGEPLRAAPSIQAALRNVEPGIVLLESGTMDQVVSRSVQDTHLALWLLGIFSAVALALAAVGIYGVMSYVVRQRTREIGTRMALGATERDILWLVMRRGAWIAACGAAIGLAVGLAATRLLGSLLYGVSSYDPVTLGAATAVLAGTAMTACYLPARRAARVDPAHTLAEQ